MEKKYILSIDRGQTAIKAALCDIRGEVIDVESLRCQPIQSPCQGWAQQDMELMWQQTAAVIKRLFADGKAHPEEIAAVSFSGQGGGNFLISEEGKAIYPGVLSLDSRHEEILNRISNPEHVEIPRTIALMRWLKEYEPEVFAKVRWILGSKDWLRYCLTGKVNADMSDTPAPADMMTREYQTACLITAGVPECIDMLPPLVYASEICGTVTEKAAEETGLLKGTPVACGAHDMIACSVGAGGNRQGHLAIIMGTLGINIAVVDQKTVLPKVKTPGESFVFGGITEGMRTATTSIGSGCNTMNRMLDVLFEQEQKEAKDRGITVFELLEERLLGREISDVIFQPYIMGTFYNSAAKAGLLGITERTTREDLLLAVFQGICISMCIEIEKLEDRVQNFDDVWMVGGGSKSRIWGQMFADVLKRPVHICTTSEVGCRGAAICAGVALGYYTLEEDFPMPEAVAVYHPRKERSEQYERQLNIYKKAYEMSVGLWK